MLPCYLPNALLYPRLCTVLYSMLFFILANGLVCVQLCISFLSSPPCHLQVAMFCLARSSLLPFQLISDIPALHAGGYKEMSSILADYSALVNEPKWGGGERGDLQGLSQ
jgi:hypothetical protein